MPDGRQKPSFWETLPGIITALVVAVAALITALYGVKILRHDEQPGKVAAKHVQETAVRKAENDTKTEAAQAASSRTVTQPVAVTKNDSSAWQQGDVFTDPITGMELVYMPQGCFQMGTNEYNGYNDESPLHEVCLDAFWMGKYEVTQGQWKTVMGENPASFKKGDDYPVEQISWEDTQKFITKLGQQSGIKYRLPTEAEWEYAARSGTSFKYSGGNNLDAVAWYRDNSAESTHPAGQKKVNAFGFYDMSGNVWEWCNDWYGKDYYASSPKDNPIGPASGAVRVLRGGSSFNDSVRCRSIFRSPGGPGLRSDAIGFRLVLPFQTPGS